MLSHWHAAWLTLGIARDAISCNVTREPEHARQPGSRRRRHADRAVHRLGLRPSLTPIRRIAVALVALGSVTAIGTVGYMLIERLSAPDALYLTVITLTTVGYGDLVPHTTAGRLFTILIILSGVGCALYLFTVGAQLVLEGQLRDVFGRTAMQRRADHMNGHVIVCGYGRFGRAVAEELGRNGAEMVIIDADPACEEELRRRGGPYVIGSAVADDVLEHAGIRRARAIVVATPSDPDNVFITLSAREKNPDIRIHARGESEAGLRRLELAGANQTLSAYHSGGVRMAASILRPSVVDFLELSMPGHHAGIALEEARIAPRCRLDGRTIGELEAEWARMRVVALERPGENVQIAPEAATVLAAGDLLVAIGEREALARLAQAASGESG
jgi:voltage-gated potassium channel